MTVSPDAPGFYHCISRCVRRAWLCGDDPMSGLNFDHRRSWIENRLLDLSESFSVGLYAWAVMSNHTHVVLRLDPVLPRSWSDEEVAFRWARLSRGLEPVPNAKVSRHASQLLLSPSRIEVIRARLGSLSWFMRFLNESIARAANAEDLCTGRFWEGRFKCQALLDDQAVLACMAYVDLNPIRAGIADDLANSSFTSIQRRLESISRDEAAADHPLDSMTGTANGQTLPTTVAGYIELLAWSGRMRGGSKRGLIGESAPDALREARGSPDWWIGSVFRIEQEFGSAVGSPLRLREFAEQTGRRWVRGL